MILYAPGHSPNNPVYSFHFPDGTEERLTFVPEEWVYYRHTPDGSLVAQDGVTSVVKCCTPVQAIKNWAVKLALAKTKQLLMEGGYVYGDGVAKKLYEEVLDDLLAKAKMADDEAFTSAGQCGTEAHDHLEKIIKTVIYENESRRHELLAKLPLDERAANAVIAVMGWWSDHNVRWKHSERKVFDREFGFAGTLDAVALMDSCQNRDCCPVEYVDRLALCDFKTSNSLRVSYLFQAAAYRHAYSAETGEKIDDTWILRLDKETAELDPWHAEGEELYQEHFKGFLNCLGTHRSIERAEDWVSGIKTGRTAVKRAAEKEVNDAAYKIECPASKDYRGSRQKKGCNGTETVCIACQKKYLDAHP